MPLDPPPSELSGMANDNSSLGAILPKAMRIRRRGSLSPLTAKRCRLDSTMGAGMDTGIGMDEAALDGCIRMTPTTDFDFVEGSTAQQLAPELEPSFTFRNAQSLTAPGPTFSGTQLLATSLTNAETSRPQAPPSSMMMVLPSLPNFATTLPSDGLQASLAALEAKSHAVRLARVTLEQSDKSTSLTYGRHVTRYEKWWATDQEEYARNNPGWTRIPAFPVTPAKVCMFLEHESNREKVPPSSLSLSLPMCALTRFLSLTEEER